MLEIRFEFLIKYFWQECLIEDERCFRAHQHQVARQVWFSTIDDVKFDHLMKVVTACCLHCKHRFSSLGLAVTLGALLWHHMNVLFSSNLSLNGLSSH